MYKVTAIPALNDNYFWLLSDDNSGVLIDPGDATPCVDILHGQSIRLDTIWVTHHHQDHTAGIQSLLELYSCPVYGPNDSRIPSITINLTANSQIQWKKYSFSVLHLPGHTKSHLVYWDAENKNLFCGDIIFSAGCGRNMEGEIADLYHSLQFLAKLPKDTVIHCAHEYTLANMKFAMHLEPNNHDIQKHYLAVTQLRSQNIPSIPTQLDLELKINPFLRSHLPSIRGQLDTIALNSNIQQELSKYRIESQDEYYFALLRLWKNIYV